MKHRTGKSVLTYKEIAKMLKRSESSVAHHYYKMCGAEHMDRGKVA
jgi:hypothetical protein